MEHSERAVRLDALRAEVESAVSKTLHDFNAGARAHGQHVTDAEIDEAVGRAMDGFKAGMRSAVDGIVAHLTGAVVPEDESEQADSAIEQANGNLTLIVTGGHADGVVGSMTFTSEPSPVVAHLAVAKILRSAATQLEGKAMAFHAAGRSEPDPIPDVFLKAFGGEA